MQTVRSIANFPKNLKKKFPLSTITSQTRAKSENKMYETIEYVAIVDDLKRIIGDKISIK